MRLFFVLVMVCCFAGSASAAKEMESGCGEILKASCQGCHNYNQICKKVGDRSKGSWGRTVKRMVTNHDADIAEDEKQILVECLATPSPEIKKICGK